MIKRVSLSLCLFVSLSLLFYLLLPPPPELPPLPQSLKSTEPGDTVQIPGVSAYYTNLSRQEVMEFYQKNFNQSSFLNIPLITYRLNHPPEYAKQIIRDTQQSNYFEEIVHPFRESLFVNGFEWETDPFTEPSQRFQNRMVINGQEFKCKVTLRPFYSNPFLRILILAGVGIISFWLGKEILKFYGSFRHHR